MTGEDGAPIMLIRSTSCVLVPAKTAKGVEVTVPLNPADYVTVYPVNESDISGAVSGIYRHKTQQKKAKYLTILYTNLSENNIVLTPGEIIGHGSMCSEVKKIKPVINIVKPAHKDKSVTDRLWSDLKLQNNEVLDEVPELKKKLYSILHEYQDVFTNDQCHVGNTSWDTFKIDLIPNAQPVRQRVRPLAPPLRENLRLQLQDWIKDEVIESSNSPWASPLVPVTKKTGHTRWCVDFRAVNRLTVSDSYPTPSISEILTSLGSSKVFSTLDASQAYMAISIEKKSRPLTAFTTAFGLFHFCRMPFGLKNAGAAYCRLVQKLVDMLGVEGVLAYLDDILLHTSDAHTHINLLNLVFEAHRAAGIVLNASKTFLFQRQVEYLGHLVSQEGIKLIPSYVSKIVEWPLPSTGKELSAFLGFAGYYREFLPGFAEVTANLNEVKNKRTVTWTTEMINNFNILKDMFTAAPCRAPPDFSPGAKPFTLTIDFSKNAVGAILSQEQQGKDRFLGVKGRKCRTYECNYHSSKGEMLALVYGLDKFSHLLRLSKFVVITDSNTVLHWSTMKDSGGTVRRWLDYIQQFDFVVKHRAGKYNTNADIISRALHMSEPNPSCTDSITQGKAELYPVPWVPVNSKEYISLSHTGEEYNEAGEAQVNHISEYIPLPQTGAVQTEYSGKQVKYFSEYIPPSCTGRICTTVDLPWHLATSHGSEGRGPALICNIQGKIGLDQKDLEKAQVEDGSLQLVRSWFNETTGKIEDKNIDTSGFEGLHSDVIQLYKVRSQLRLSDKSSTGDVRLVYLLEDEFEPEPRYRFVIPPSHRYQAMTVVHAVQHWGVQRTTQQVKQVFYWPGWRKDVSVFVTECAGCLHREQINLKQVEPYEDRAKNVNDVLCMDLVGPLTMSPDKNKYILSMMCQYSRFVCCVPLPDKSAKSVSNAIMKHWIGLYGTPTSIRTDAGS